jgi:hypothetical protein
MPTAFTGNAAYCFSNSLHMTLLGSGAAPGTVPEPGFLECLTGMPFGKTYLPARRTFWPSAPGFSPEQGGGLDAAIATLGWSCEAWFASGTGADAAGEDAAPEALSRLREGLRRGPALLGPVDFGFLSYSPHAAHMAGADHYVVALALEGDHLLLHDPAGAPYAVLPVADFLEAWRAARVGYKRGAYTLRTDFRSVAPVPRRRMIERTLPLARRNAGADPGGPSTYGGGEALARLASDLRGDVSETMVAHLLGFSFPTAARRTVDAACFLAEGGRSGASALLDRQARLWGRVNATAAQPHWEDAAGLVGEIAALERELAASL